MKERTQLIVQSVGREQIIKLILSTKWLKSIFLKKLKS